MGKRSVASVWILLSAQLMQVSNLIFRNLPKRTMFAKTFREGIPALLDLLSGMYSTRFGSLGGGA